MTVAHYLNNLEKWRAQERLLGVRLIIHYESGECDLITLDLDKNPCFCSNEVDLGLVLLSRNIVEKIIKHRGKVIQVSETSADIVPDIFILVGHAASYAKLATDTIATDKNTGEEWQCSRLSCLATVFVPLYLDGDSDRAHTYKFTPQAGINDFAGASGGPIFGYKNGSPINEYSLFAIQSSQIKAATREQKVKHLVATSGAFAVKAIKEWLNTLGTK